MSKILIFCICITSYSLSDAPLVNLHIKKKCFTIVLKIKKKRHGMDVIWQFQLVGMMPRSQWRRRYTCEFILIYFKTSNKPQKSVIPECFQYNPLKVCFSLCRTDWWLRTTLQPSFTDSHLPLGYLHVGGVIACANLWVHWTLPIYTVCCCHQPFLADKGGSTKMHGIKMKWDYPRPSFSSGITSTYNPCSIVLSYQALSTS